MFSAPPDGSPSGSVGRPTGRPGMATGKLRGRRPVAIGREAWKRNADRPRPRSAWLRALPSSRRRQRQDLYLSMTPVDLIYPSYHHPDLDGKIARSSQSVRHPRPQISTPWPQSSESATTNPRCFSTPAGFRPAHRHRCGYCQAKRTTRVGSTHASSRRPISTLDW